jgi:2-dehydro-3-deoxygluconokinase
MGLKIQPASECEFDLLALGECMIRLSPPGHQRIELTPVFEAFAGGGEYNVAYALARYGMRTGWVSRLVENPLGHFIRNHAHASGMDLSEVIWVPYDGVGRADRIGLNFTEVGIGVRASVTLYDRGHTAIAHMKPGEVNWNKIFRKRRARWFHTGGIFTALSDSCADVVLEAMKAAHDGGTIVSYDLNFRSKLWSSKRAIEVTNMLIPYIDVLIGNEEDFQKVLGFTVEGTDENLKALPVEGYKEMVQKVVKVYPNVHAVGTTLREVVSGLVTTGQQLCTLMVPSTVLAATRISRLRTASGVAMVSAAALCMDSCMACPLNSALKWEPRTERSFNQRVGIPAWSPWKR